MINIERKEDSVEKLAAVQGKPTKHYLFANEVNEIVESLQGLSQTVNPNRIISTGTEIKDGNQYTYVDYQWMINGQIFENYNRPLSILINPTTPGYKRNDIAVFTNTGDIMQVQGEETNGEVVTSPDVPPGAILLKIYNVVGDQITIDPTPIIVGNQFVEKTDFNPYNSNVTGTDATIPLDPNGYSEIRLTNTGLVSLAGYDLSLISGNPNAKAPYPGKPFIILNLTGHEVVIKKELPAADYPFYFSETDLVFPNNHYIYTTYDPSGFRIIFKSWHNTNLSIKNQAGVTHTITSDDVKSKLIVFNSSSDVVLTIPNNSVLPLEIGANFSVVNKGTGAMTTQGAAGVTIRTKNATPAVSNDLRNYVKLSENEWLEDTDFEQVRFAPLSAYLDIINGNDSTAKIEDSKKPFKTMAALISALPATTGETFTIYISGGTIPITRKMPIRNLNFVAYSAATLDFTNCKEDDGVTDAALVLSTFGSTLYNNTTVAPNWNFSGTNISLICNFVGRKIFSHIEQTGSAQSGLSLTGTINKLDWRSTATTAGVLFGSFYIKTANLIINELYDSSQVRPNFFFTGIGTVNYPAVITIRKLILSYRNYMCSYVTGNSGFSTSIIIESVTQAVTNSQNFIINSTYAKIGNVTMTGKFRPQVGTIEFSSTTLSSDCTVDFNATYVIRGTLNSETYCDSGWGGYPVLFENFNGKLRNLLAVGISSYTFRNCVLNLNGLLISNFSSSVNNLILFEGINTINQLDANASLVTTSYNCTVSIKGVLTTNMTSLGPNITSVYQTATFKEKLQEIVVRSKKDLVNRTLSSSTTYVVDGTLILSSGEYIEIPAGGLTLTGYGFDVSKIQKNISGQSIFKSPVGGSGNLVSKDIEYNSGLGSVFNITDSDGSHAIEFNDVNFVGCNSLGTISNYRQFTATTCGIYGCASGFVLDGTWTGFKMVNTNAFSFGATGKLFSAGPTLTFSNRFFIELNLSLPIGAVIADFTDANFLNNKLLQVTNCFIKVNGVIDPDYTPALFPGITPSSMKSYFVNNIGLRNTPIEPYSMRGSNFRVCDDDLEAASQDVAVGEFYIEAATGYLRQRLT